MFVPIRPRDRRILLLELLFMWDIFRGAGRGGCPNDGGLRRLSRLGGGVGQEVQHATGALGAALGASVNRIGASVIDILANSKIRFDGVKRMTQIQNTS